MNNFTTIIGSGGYGLIVKHTKDPIVVKLLYGGACEDSQIEYKKHLDVYEAFESSRSEQYKQICISKPLAYDKEHIHKFGQTFSCYYMMSLLKSIGNDGLYHIINDDYKRTVDRQVGRNYREPISDSNPSRGFFASYSYISNKILPFNLSNKGNLSNITNLIRYMGFSFGVIAFVAEYLPKDVEYTLGLSSSDELCFCVLDFGMIHKLSFDPDFISEEQRVKKLKKIAYELYGEFDIDMYFPTDIDHQMVFLEGMKDSLEGVSSHHMSEKTFVYVEFKELVLANE